MQVEIVYLFKFNSNANASVFFSVLAYDSTDGGNLPVFILFRFFGIFTHDAIFIMI